MSGHRIDTNVPPELNGTDELRVYEHNRPGLEASDYNIVMTQALSGPANASFQASKSIAVAGDRVSLPPDRIHSVFPPTNAQGDFWHLLPHIALTRSTLPWERSAIEAIEDKNLRPPWLRLLVFDEDEMAHVDRLGVTLADLITPKTDGSVSWPGLTIGSSQHREDQVSVIDVPMPLAQALLPATVADLTLTTHVRRVSPLKLTYRIYDTENLGAHLHVLSNHWFDDKLKQVFEAEDMPLGDMSKVFWFDSQENEGGWTFKIPDVGHFEARQIQAGGGLRVLGLSGGAISDTGPTSKLERHNVAIVEAPLQAVFYELENFTVTDWLMEFTDMVGLTLREPVVHIEKDGQEWRITCAQTGLHLGVRRAAHGAVELLTYADPQSEIAIIVANRLPMPGKRCVVHLVSLEDRYELPDADGSMRLRDELISHDAEKLRLITLKSWDFDCTDQKADFAGLLERVNLEEDTQNQSVPLLTLPYSQDALTGDDVAAKVAARLANGDIPLRHKMRRGDRSVSWYRGPLVPDTKRGAAFSANLPAENSDSLVQFDEDLGMFDVSYAAAWEIGRLMMLADTKMATKLYQWKRAHAHQLAAAREHTSFAMHLPLKHRIGSNVDHGRVPELPPELRAWFDDLCLLRRIPYRYLVPDENLLANNSLKFFHIDPVWLACLRDGAFSIGRVLQSDHHADHHRQKALGDLPEISGFLLRSEVVPDYPDLGTVAYDTEPEDADKLRAHPDLKPLPCLRQDRLGKYILLSLFEGEVRALDIHRAPQTLHFGFNPCDLDKIEDPRMRSRFPMAIARRDPGTLCKLLRGRGGDQISEMIWPSLIKSSDGLPFDELRVVDFSTLSSRMAQHLPTDGALVWHDGLNPAKFAMEMMEGADLVRFVHTGLQAKQEVTK